MSGETNPMIRGLGAAVCLGLALLVSGCLWFGNKPSTDPREADPDDLTWVQTQADLVPREPYWPYRAAELHAEQGELAEAEAMLARTLEVDPVYPPALSLQSRIYYETGRHAEAVALLEDALRGSGDRLPRELREGLALHYEALGDPATGADLLASGPDPGSPASPVHTFLMLRGENYGAAAEPARRALEEDTENAAHCNNYGIARLQAGHPYEARALLLQAHVIDPGLPGPLYNLAILEEFYLMNHEEAASWFSRYWSLSQEDPDHLREVFTDPPEGEGPIETPSENEKQPGGEKP